MNNSGAYEQSGLTLLPMTSGYSRLFGVVSPRSFAVAGSRVEQLTSKLSHSTVDVVLQTTA